MEYPYSQRNLLVEPQAYMYPPFGGWDFLEAYLQSRKAFCERILNDLEAAFPLDLPICRRAAFVLTQGRGKVLVDRSDILGEFRLIAAQIPPHDEGKTYVEPLDTSTMLRQWLARPESFAVLDTDATLRGLVRRFEVSKKLPRMLTPPHFPLAGTPLHDIGTYARFAAVLSLAGATSQDLRILNCLLKVCDLLASLPHGDWELKTDFWALLAFLYELSLIRDMWPA